LADRRGHPQPPSDGADYDDRRRRQAEGTAKAKAADLYKGRLENKTRNAAISSLLGNGRSWRKIMDATGCSRTLLAKFARDRRLLKVEPAIETDD
jgi:DNA invertase Pin-like site-specific DNA recombinase